MFLGDLFIPERERSSLLRRHLTLLLDRSGLPASVQRFALSVRRLQEYLQRLRTDYQLRLSHTTNPDESSDLVDFLLSVGSKPVALRATPQHLVGDVKKIPETLRSLVIAALQTDADLIVTEVPERLARAKDAEAWSVAVTNRDRALREAEIFARGHDIPWSFQKPMAYCPFGEFYALIEPAHNLRALRGLLQQRAKSGFDADIVEVARSLAYNRPVAISYTRDKLLFYKQQRRAASRRSLTRQKFWFESGYFSNHYYLLMWGGVDQICWLINEVLRLGFDRSNRADWKHVGPTKTPFLDQLRIADEALHALFKDADFLHWFKVLRAARHYAAHHGIVTPAQLLEPPKVAPSEEEIEREVEAELGSMKELQEQGIAEREIIDWMREIYRQTKRLEYYTVLADDYIEIEIDGNKVGIRPLLNVEWDFKNYTTFVDACAERCCHWLRTSGNTS